MKNKRQARILQKSLSVLLAVFIIGVSVKERQSIIKVLYNIQPRWALSGLLCYFINYFFRALRFKIISGGKIKIWPDSIHAASVHGLASYMFPFRIGEIALPVILNSVSGLPLTEAGRILLKARLLDIISLGIIMLGVAAGSDIMISSFFRFLWISISILMCLAPFIIKWLWKLKLFAGLKASLSLKKFENITSIKFYEIFLTMCIWTAVALCFYYAARAIGLHLKFSAMWVLISLQLPMQIIPVQGIANSGNHEGGWIAALSLLGFTVGESMNFALASHVLILIYVISLGPVALVTRTMVKYN